jgi:hypothetical protein
MMKEPFLSDANIKTRRSVGKHMPQIVSFSLETSSRSNLERLAMSAYDGNSVEVDLFSLVMNFVGNITGEMLLGKAFFDNNPGILQDLWRFDDGFGMFLSGFPKATSKGRKAVRARNRLNTAFNE